MLAPRFEKICLWFHEPELAAAAADTRENSIFLPGILLPANIRPESSLEPALRSADVVLGVMPSHAARSVYQAARPHIPAGTPIVSATKGLDSVTLLRMSQVIGEVFGATFPVGVISGPSFASEVAEGKPTALVCGSRDPNLVAAVQDGFSGETLPGIRQFGPDWSRTRRRVEERDRDRAPGSATGWRSATMPWRR